jgi:hypothetical protein
VGPTLVVLGALGFVAAVAMSKASFERGNPEAARAGRPPEPGTGDVPSWISGLYLVSVAVAVVGAIVWIAN